MLCSHWRFLCQLSIRFLTQKEALCYFVLFRLRSSYMFKMCCHISMCQPLLTGCLPKGPVKVHMEHRAKGQRLILLDSAQSTQHRLPHEAGETKNTCNTF